ncbi:MAG: cytochrome oxidase subunit III [Anaerolineae bacterium]|nr:MAG: cytochrome oxidase subunit III [Anaerolineae bacterium]
MSQTATPGSGGQAVLREAEHHFDYTGRKLGMWLFLFTELLLFGGLFIAYAIYRHVNFADFHVAAKDLDLVLGTINTVILLTSSLTMALSITAMQKGNRKLAVWLVVLTVLCGLAFLIIKYFEWTAKISHGIYPASPELMKLPPGEVRFFGLYYAMTGLHGLHVLIGMVLLIVMAVVIARKPFRVHSFRLDDADETMAGARPAIVDGDGKPLWKGGIIDENVEQVSVVVRLKPGPQTIHPSDYVSLENAGLYWHLVDIIWIFLFPLFYLIT